ncbi:MAG TPA: MotA/TolQ/ExbB proton channel family protein [Verrucomicrobiae bacterium]
MEIAILVLLGITSIVSLTFIIERGLALRESKITPAQVESAVQAIKHPGDVATLRASCQYSPSTLGRLVLFVLERSQWSKEDVVDALQIRARHEIARLERGLVFLEIATGIAPLLGLTGTVYGMIALFGDIGSAGLGDNTAFARGIAIALKATLMGLLVAIPSLVAWSYYTKRVDHFTVELEIICDELIRKLYPSETEQLKTSGMNQPAAKVL